jgi:Pyridine nucleotide-disulphide oxidoreductase, dimerisation domain
MTPNGERLRLTREWRRRAEVPIRLVVTEPQINVLLARGYELDRTDKESIARAVSLLLADDFPIVHDNLAGGNRSTRDGLVPYCMFTDPPLAHVGLSEGEAERRGVIARVARLPMDSVLGAQATDQREGFMKALVGENDDRILGFTMIGATAGEVMAAVQTAMMAGLPYPTLANAAPAHPTMAEGLSMLFLRFLSTAGNDGDHP